MKRSSTFKQAAIILIIAAMTFGLQAQENRTDWKAFSVNLVKAIKSGHPGLQNSAMQRIIQYADKLDVSEAVYHIGRIYGFDINPKVRRLAMITLHKISSDKSMYYLQKYLPLETNPNMRSQCCCILNEYCMAKNITPKDLKLAVK